MSADGLVFVDTNILLYAYDLDAGPRHAAARDVVRGLWHAGTGVLSTQVLQEFYVNVTAKIPVPLAPAAARGVVAQYLAWRVQTLKPESVLAASEIGERHRLSFWGALIIVAAIDAGARTLYTEDLNPGQVVEGVQIHNPLF